MGSHLSRAGGRTPITSDTTRVTAALGVLASLVPAFITVQGSIGSQNASVDRFLFAVIGAFMVFLSGHTFLPKSPAVAQFFDSAAVIFVAGAFASVVPLILDGGYKWAAYVLSMLPLLPLFHTLGLQFLSWVCERLHRWSNIVGGWFQPRVLPTTEYGLEAGGGLPQSTL